MRENEIDEIKSRHVFVGTSSRRVSKPTAYDNVYERLICVFHIPFLIARIMKSTLILMLIHEGPCAGDRLFIPKSFVLKKWGGDDHGANCGLRR